MSFLACLPLIEADITAVLALDQRCLGGLWSRSGYQRELESDHSDLRVLVAATHEADLLRRAAFSSRQEGNEINPATKIDLIAAQDATHPSSSNLQLLGVGCLWAILEEAHITTLAIEPSYQGRKLGQLLLSDLLGQGQRRGLTRATLEVRASNQVALKLYQKFGFQEAGERKRYYSNGENARILWRSGLQAPEFSSQLRAHQEGAIAQLTKHGMAVSIT